MKKNPVILVYRRNHTGDPSESGVFGFHDCMGQIRNPGFDAVIGIGGIKPWEGDEGIREKITWVGIGPAWTNASDSDLARMRSQHADFHGFRGQMVTFDNFLMENERGPNLIDVSPALHGYMFQQRKIPRAAKNFSQVPLIYSELIKILKLAENSPASSARNIDASSAGKRIGRSCR